MKKLIGIIILLTVTVAVAHAQLTIFSTDLTTTFKIEDQEVGKLNTIISLNNHYEYGWEYPTGGFGLNSAYYSEHYDYGTGGTSSPGENKTDGPSSATAPEPTTLVLIGIGLAGLGIRKKFSK